MYGKYRAQNDPNLCHVFMDTKPAVSETYKSCAIAQLSKDLPSHLIKDIKSVLAKHNHHYLPALKELQNDAKFGRIKKKRPTRSLPTELDDVFIKELCYSKIENEIKAHHLKIEEDRKKAFLLAKESGTLIECQCCFDDEVLEIDMSPCSSEDQHCFCNNCIKRHVSAQIGQGSNKFRCLQGECTFEFPLKVLKKVLVPSVFSNILKRKQLEEIAAAGIPDLETCPFCDFSTIMPNKEDKLFKCLNPECLKDSCRLCKEQNHIPLKCDEVTTKQTAARTFLENAMTEAIIRECHKCHNRFIKEEGCNKMTCSCGAISCYLCKIPIPGYGHFQNHGGKCPLYTNSLQLHAEEVEKGAKEAKKQIDPAIQLEHDPTKDLPQVPDYLKNPPPRNNNNNNNNNQNLHPLRQGFVQYPPRFGIYGPLPPAPPIPIPNFQRPIHPNFLPVFYDRFNGFQQRPALPPAPYRRFGHPLDLRLPYDFQRDFL